MIRPKGLGRGLDALLAGVDEPASSGETLRMIATARILMPKSVVRLSAGVFRVKLKTN